MNTCPFCNSSVDLDSTFCPHCGRNISALNAGNAGRMGSRKWLVTGLVAGLGIMIGAVTLWAQGGSAAWLTAKLGLTQTAAFPATASAGGCCTSGAAKSDGQAGGGCGMMASGAGCGGGGCGSSAGSISDDEAYQAAESVLAFWASRYNQNDLKVEVYNKGCHVEMRVLLKDTPLKSYKYTKGNITAI